MALSIDPKQEAFEDDRIILYNPIDTDMIQCHFMSKLKLFDNYGGVLF